MAYVKAVIGAVVVGLLVGGVTGMVEVFTGAVAKLQPEDKAVVYGGTVGCGCQRGIWRLSGARRMLARRF